MTEKPSYQYVNNHHDSTKQDVISDLATIRSGAALGATALQPSDLTDYALKTDLSQFQTSEIEDVGGYFTTDTVEDALQEIGSTLDGLETAINTIRGVS